MGFVDDYLKGQARSKVTQYAFAIVIAVLKEAGEIALEELAKGLEEFRRQGKTPDGWTREEYLTYAIGRLRVVQSRKIGPWVVDEVLDYCIDKLIDVLEGRAANVDDDGDVDDEPAPAPAPPPVQPPVVTPPPPPVVVPPVEQPVEPPATPKDPYYPTLYGPNDPIPYELLVTKDLVYRKELNRFVVPWRMAKYPLFKQAVENATLIDIVGDDNQ